MPDPLPEVYVGPRPFERSERNLFFGRDREISELLSLVTSSRVVLCYAPSGAGKTSLINAGLQPRLEKEGFEVLPPTRVRGFIPEEIPQEKIPNVYVFNALLSLAGEAGAPAELADSSLTEFLASRPQLTDEEGFPAPRILIFDQFEELLTSYTERWQERDGFFHQVRDALEANSLLRVVFVMREDFLARIEPFTRLLKPLPQAHFRLDLLKADGAHAAVTGPLRATNRHFKEGVVSALIEELLKVRVETAQGQAVEVIGEYVEPVQLQVVCRNLWTSLPPEVQEISSEHLKAYGDVDQALQDFYESCLAQARASQGTSEQTLRQWFEQQLITPAGTRGIVFRDAHRTANLPNPVVEFMENRHLIRGEWRAGSRWYELTHDRLIEPIQRANARWRARRLERRNRLLLAGVLPVLLGLILFSVFLTNQQTTSPSSMDVSTFVAATVGVDRATAQVQAEVAEADIALSRSRQLAAEALLANNPDLALLLAIRANQFAGTVEARRSLHLILSRQAVIDGRFLRELNPEILSPGLSQRFAAHDNWILDVAFSPDGQQFVTTSADRTLILWDRTTLEPLLPPFSGHASNVQTAAFSPDGRLIASGGLDRQVRIWVASTGETRTILEGHSGLVTSVAFSPDGGRLASGGEDNTIRIWNLSDGTSIVVEEPAEIWSLAWSPDGKTLATASAGSYLHLWDTETFEKPRTFVAHQGLVRSVVWSPDGRMLASASLPPEGERGLSEVFLWDVASGRILSRPLRQSVLPVRTVAFDPSGRLLAMGRDDGTILFWDLRGEQMLETPLKAHNHRVMKVVFSPGGRQMLSGSIDQTAALWDLVGPTNSVAISPTGDLLAASQGAGISLWGVSADQSSLLWTHAGLPGDVRALGFSPDGSILASGGTDDTVRLWDATNGEELRLLTGHSSDVIELVFSPDGSRLASADEDGEIFLWDLATHLRFNTFQHRGPVIRVWFDVDGETLQVAGRDGSLTVLDVNTGESQAEAPLAVQGGVTLSSLAVSPDRQGAAFATELGAAFLDDTGRAHGIELPILSDSFDPSVNPGDVDFIVIKASQGLQVDPRFEEFLPSIQVVPIRGAMHFYRPDQPWQEQADLFLSLVKDQGFHFYTLDLELTPEDGSTTFLSEAEQWMNYVQERVEGKVLLQAGGFYLTRFGTAGDWMKEWPLLIMSYSMEPDPSSSPLLPQGIGDWKLWQYTERGQGTAYGVAGTSVPLEVYNGTPQEMWTWLELPDFAIYDRAQNRLIRPGQAIRVAGRNGIAYSPDSLFVAAAGKATVSLLDAASGEELTSLALVGRPALSLGFTPDGGTLVIGMDDGRIMLWDLSLLQEGTDPEATLEAACSQVNRDFTESEWNQFLAGIPQDNTCSGLPR